jgi:hypothetical protein
VIPDPTGFKNAKRGPGHFKNAARPEMWNGHQKITPYPDPGA